MGENVSASGGKFGFNKPDTTKEEQKDKAESPVEGTVLEPENKTAKEKVDEDFEREYTDNRSVTISLVKNTSLFRKANDKVMPKRRDYIGSSINTSRILTSNKEEIEAYFPNIIGLAPNHPDFIWRIKTYLNNIQILVDEMGRTFDITFVYYKKKDWVRFKREEEEIEQEYRKVDRGDIAKLKAALKLKISKLNALESSKHKYGYPVNVEEYLMYRHCLLYNDVAKDIAFINSDSSIRFYFKDDQKEKEKLHKHRNEVNKAKANYVSCLADDDLFDAIYIQYCTLNGLPVISSLQEDRLDREIKLDRFSTEEPTKFNKIFYNKDVKLIATIETLVAHGELIKSQYNQNIITPEGEFIGANIGEAVAWFKNPENASAANAFYNRLKNI